MNTHSLTPRAQRAFARTAQAVSAARADFAAAQSALQKALARGVDVEATLSQATDVISEVPGTPLPKTLGPEETAVERVYDRLGELLDTCKEYDAIHHELEVDTCLADAATNIQGDLRRLHAQWERCGDALKSLESCLPSPPRGTPVDTGASAGTTFLVQGVEVMMPDFASTPTTPASELVKTLRNKLRDAGHESASLVELPESMLANEEWLAMALKHLTPAAQAAANVRVQCGHRGSGDPHAGSAPPSSNNPAPAAGHLQPRVLRFGTGAAQTLAPDAAQLAADVEDLKRKLAAHEGRAAASKKLRTGRQDNDAACDVTARSSGHGSSISRTRAQASACMPARRRRTSWCAGWRSPLLCAG